MTGDRRPGRAALEFFHDLDRQLPSERGLNGEPSTSDFQTFELLAIIEMFATRFDELPVLITGQRLSHPRVDQRGRTRLHRRRPGSG